MPLDEDNIIEQLAQIESELSSESTADSEISNVSQIESIIGSVIPIDLSGFYDGSISANDWILQGGYYYYTVSRSTHKLVNPMLDNVLVSTEDGYDNSYYSFTRMPNDDIRFRSSMAVDCVYRITGQR